MIWSEEEFGMAKVEILDESRTMAELQVKEHKLDNKFWTRYLKCPTCKKKADFQLGYSMYADHRCPNQHFWHVHQNVQFDHKMIVSATISKYGRPLYHSDTLLPECTLCHDPTMANL